MRDDMLHRIARKAGDTFTPGQVYRTVCGADQEYQPMPDPITDAERNRPICAACHRLACEAEADMMETIFDWLTEADDTLKCVMGVYRQQRPYAFILGPSEPAGEDWNGLLRAYVAGEVAYGWAVTDPGPETGTVFQLMTVGEGEPGYAWIANPTMLQGREADGAPAPA